MASPATSPAGDTTQQEAVQLACLALTKPGDAGAAASAAVLGAAHIITGPNAKFNAWIFEAVISGGSGSSAATRVNASEPVATP